MNEKSTLIFLVNQIKSEVINSAIIGLSGPDYEPLNHDDNDYHAPPERAVKALLGYARSLEVSDLEELGKIEWVLN